MSESKWIEFAGPVPTESGKTSVWCVRPKGTTKEIGFIGWYGPWRRYAFQPEPNTVFEPTCLRDIAAFIDEQMQKRKR